MNDKKNAFVYFSLITLIFVSFYVIALNYIVSSLDILDFVKNSPDKKLFKELFEKLKNESIFSIIKNGETVINLQFDILSRHISNQIIQIVLLYISIVTIGYCLRKYLNVSEYIVYIVFFIPSFIYLVALNLKDFYIFFALANSFFIFFIISQDEYKFKFYQYTFLLFLIFLNTYFFYFSKPYLFYLITSITFIFILFKYFFSFIKKRAFNFKLFYCLGLFLIFFVILHFIYGDTLVPGRHKIFISHLSDDFFWKFNDLIPNQIEYLIKTATEIRLSNINYNFLTNSSSLVTGTIIPNSTNEFIYFFPYLFFKSIFPFDLSLTTDVPSIVYFMSILEQLLIVFLVIYYLIFQKKNFLGLYILALYLIGSFIFFYINPNLGTFFRYKSIIQLPLILLLSSNLIDFIRKNYFYNQTTQYFMDNYLAFLCMGIAILFFFLRDLILINLLKDSIFLNFLIYFLILLSFLSNLFISSLVSTFINIRNYKINIVVYIYFIPTYILFISITILLLIFVDQNIFHKSFLIDNITYILLLLLSIPINSILASKLINHGKRLYIFTFQLLVPTLSILLIIDNNDLVKNTFLILFLSSYVYSLMLLIVLIRLNKNNFTSSLGLHKRFVKIICSFNKRFLNKISLQLVLFFSLIQSMIYLLSLDSNTIFNYFIFKIILLFFSMINLFISYYKINFDNNEFDLNSFYFLNLNISILLIIIFYFLNPIIELLTPLNVQQISQSGRSGIILILVPILVSMTINIRSYINQNRNISNLHIKIIFFIISGTILIILLDNIYYKFLIILISNLFINFYLTKTLKNFMNYFILSILFLYINYLSYEIFFQNHTIYFVNFFISLFVLLIFKLKLKNFFYKI